MDSLLSVLFVLSVLSVLVHLNYSTNHPRCQPVFKKILRGFGFIRQTAGIFAISLAFSPPYCYTMARKAMTSGCFCAKKLCVCAFSCINAMDTEHSKIPTEESYMVPDVHNFLRILTTTEPGPPVLFAPFVSQYLTEQLIWRRGIHLCFIQCSVD